MSSELQSNLRVRLGPVATALIEGREDNPRQALDDAIQALTDRLEAAPKPGADHSELAGRIDVLTHDVRDLSECIRDHSDVLSSALTEQVNMLAAFKQKVLMELQTSRIYVAALVETQGGQGHEEVLELGREMVEEIRAISGVVSDEERRELERQEDLQLEVVRLQVERAIESEQTELAPSQRSQEPELER